MYYRVEGTGLLPELYIANNYVDLINILIKQFGLKDKKYNLQGDILYVYSTTKNIQIYKI